MNKAILMGRLVRDPELRSTQSNIPVCTFTLAVDRRMKNANGERQADFIPIVAWRQSAEFASKYFRQGMRIVVVGSIQRRSWEDAEGRKRYETEVIADELHFAESKRSDAGQDYGSRPAPSTGSYGQPSPRAERPYETAAGDRFMAASEEDDTSLPFDV